MNRPGIPSSPDEYLLGHLIIIIEDDPFVLNLRPIAIFSSPMRELLKPVIL